MTDLTVSAAEAAAKPRPPFKALVPLVAYAKKHQGRIGLALISLIIASIATLVVPFAVRRMIDYGFSSDSAGLINVYFGLMIVVVGVLAGSSGARYYLVMTIGERVVADMRADVFRHLTSLDAAFYDTAKIGELVSRLTADTTQLKSAFGSSASIALRNLFLFMGAIAMMVYTSAKLSGLVMIVIPVIVLPLVWAGRSVRGRARAAQDTLSNATAFAAENLGAVRTLQAFNAQTLTTSRFSKAVEDAYDAACHATMARSILTTIAIFLAFASLVGVLWLGAHDVYSGQMTAGTLSQFVLYAVFGASSLAQLSEVWSELSAAAGSAGRITELLSIAPGIVAPAHPIAMPVPARGQVNFEGVNFAYPTRADGQIIHGLTLSVAPGETVAIVGPSGAGKTTVFQLLMRFYDPTGGRIRIDGVDLRDADPTDVRARIALVAQEPVIFGATVADNIAFGHPDADRSMIVEAAKRAAAHDFIEAMPEGYDTRIGERGITLSGGQRQRIAIARSILKNAPILLLDEATSALDAENETLVQTALENIMGDRTTIVVAHRLATILKADRILVMDGGVIVEEGTHATLVARNGLYARLARLQFETGSAAMGETADAAE